MSIFTCIPSAMYHHVNRSQEDSISINPENFEAQIKYLAESGYKSLHLDEYFHYLKKWSIPEKLILITFDDGYGDNFMHAYPILKKYSMKATIFPVTAFVKDKVEKRTEQSMHNFEILMKTPTVKGGMDEFLSWDEMKQMLDGGLIDIQAHCHTHAAYYEEDKILNFYEGSVNTKLGWATNGDTRLGIPVYRTGPALCIRRYFDDAGLRDKIAKFVESSGGRDFFMRHNAQDILFDMVKKHGKVHGRFETALESDKRIMDELHLTKELIEKKLNKKVDYICWPWGSVDSPLIKRAKRAGFVGGIGMKPGANAHLTNKMNIHRFNASPKSIPSLKRKLFKHSKLFFSLYDDKRIDDLLIPVRKFK
jgi:peptidoglycan/xylan/chitin deacetylase (PgdA/CDA1 family)